MDLTLPRLPRRLWHLPVRQRQPTLRLPVNIGTLTKSGQPPRRPTIATLVESADEHPRGMIRFPFLASYLVPTTWSDLDHLYETGGPLHIVVREPLRRVSLYKTQKLPHGLFAVSCFVTSQGRDSFEYAVEQTKGEALQRLKEGIRGKYGNA